ncbi:A24 family peptidase [Phenylobacterium deserti]|uniref:Peptidase n=1 Tax=Phenylobacterium deserti TaxID=1914756 RepID=A0A328AD19_9CAUL|nr:A24 family peptidase [Phenylobacterium deserti]RAK52530.1 peptidase [Phenylobacterium deserti]
MFALAVFCLILVVAAVWDVTSYRIPNALCAALALAALLLALPDGAGEWLSRGASVAVIGGAVLALYLVGGMGGGDVKLLAAAAMWMPFESLPVFVMALALVGGVQAALTIAARRLAPAAANGPGAERRRMPYGLSIAGAGLAWALAATAV